MAKSIPALVEPKLLSWARKTAGYDVPSAAKKIGETEERLTAWENGKEKPTVAKMRKVATVYKRPLAVFYLAEPPKDFSVLKDFRRLPQQARRPYSPQLRFLIRRVKERHSWAAEVREDQRYEKLPFVASVAIGDDPVVVAKRIRGLLKVTVDEQQSWKSVQEALKNWIVKCDSIGIMVFQSNTVPLNEMRGFVSIDEYAPAVLLNANDRFLAARIFTLLHEVVHVFLGAEGVSNLNISKGRATSSAQKVEMFCNAVAAEALMPEADLRERLGPQRKREDDETITIIVRRYKVSHKAACLRLVDLGYASQAFYRAKRAQYEGQPAPQRKGEFRIPRYVMVLRDNGRSFTRLALGAYGDGSITGAELSNLLNMKLNHLNSLESELNPTRVHSVIE